MKWVRYLLAKLLFKRILILTVGLLSAYLVATYIQGSVGRVNAQGCSSNPIPGGGTITFESKRDGYQELYVIDGSECNIYQLTHDQYFAYAADWSPDGSKVAYTSTDSYLYVMNADGSGRHQFLSSAPGTHGYPDWSPDGSKIVFNIDVGWQAIWVANADGTDLTQLVSVPGRDNGSPIWTPDGTHIIYSDRTDPGNDAEIAIMNADGSNRHYLMPDNSSADGYPSLSPDGGKIAFVSDRDGNWEIYIMDFDGVSGSNVQRLTNSPAEDSWPRWSPDGTRLVFHSDRDGNWEIYVMYADGTNQTRITNNSAFDYQPTWGGPRLNQPPTVDAGGTYGVDEGSSVVVTATGNDPEGRPLTFAWDLNNDNVFETPGQSITFSAAGLDGPSSQPIAVQVTDDGNLSATDHATVEVQNVVPTVGAINGPAGPVQVNNPINVNANFTDPGVLDTHTAVWDWGDNTTSPGTVSETNGSGSVSDSHTYSSPGTYTVQVTVTDKDGGSGSSSLVVEVEIPNQSPDCSAATSSVDKIWPANHQFVSVDVLGVTDPDGDAVLITIDSIFQDEPVNSNGDGDTSPDGQGVSTATAQVRAERDGGGNGRVYHISFTADDGNGGSCSGEVLAGVPHDKKDTPVDDGALYDSTVP